MENPPASKNPSPSKEISSTETGASRIKTPPLSQQGFPAGPKSKTPFPPRPPTPGPKSSKRPTAPKAFSPDTYISLLEHENEQLRLLNRELQEHIKSLEAKIDVEKERRRLSTEQIGRHSEELKHRDKLIADIADTIISEFQRYKDVLTSRGEEVTVCYSGFDSDSTV